MYEVGPENIPSWLHRRCTNHCCYINNSCTFSGDNSYMVEYDSTVKKNEILLSATTWMDLQDMLSEISQTEKDKCQMIFLVCGI